MALTVTSSTNGTKLFAVGSSVARVSFFNGQLLTQRDLQAEQRFHLLLQRVVQRESFGTGTVAGLDVTDEFDSTVLPRGIFITPGLAFDPGGRELLLEQVVTVDVADPPLPFTSTSFGLLPGAGRGELADAVAARFGGPIGADDITQLAVDLTGAGLMTPSELETYLDDPTNINDIMAILERIPAQTAELPGPLLLREFLYNELVGQTYVGVKYREAGINPAPAVLDAACCGKTPCFPTRTQESLFVVTSESPFPLIDDPFETFKLCLEQQFFSQLDASEPAPAQLDVRAALCSCLRSAWRGNPPLDAGCEAMDAPIVPLAKVFWSRFALDADTQILNIDNCSIRPLAPGGPAIRALLEGLTGSAAPSTLAPRIVAIDPPNGANVPASQTLSNFKLTATFDATLASSPAASAAWQLLYYAPETSDPAVFSGSSGPAGSTATAQYVVPAGSGATALEVSFSGVVNPGFGLGTYVFRIMNGGTAAIPAPGTALTSAVTGTQVDGEPNPPTAVPSGDGLPGGRFEARFVVTGG